MNIQIITSFAKRIHSTLSLKFLIAIALFFFLFMAAKPSSVSAAASCAWCARADQCGGPPAGSGAGYCNTAIDVCCAGWNPGTPTGTAAPAPSGSPTFNAAACNNACKAEKGQINGGVVSGRQVNGRNDGNVANCECYCSSGTWTQGYAACTGTGPVIYPECTPGQKGTRQQDNCSYTCNGSGIWVKDNPACGTTGTIPTPTPGTGIPAGAECNPGSRPSGNEFYNIDADIQCGTCGEGATFGRFCTKSGKWSSGCVRAHACGYTTNVECGDTDRNDSTPDVSCESRGYPAAHCVDYRCVDNQTNDYFIGCDPTDPCKNCWRDVGNGVVTCKLEDSSCSANVNCRQSTTPTTNTCYRCHTGANFCESYTSTTACTTNCNSCPGSTATPTTPPFVCVSVTKDVAAPAFGQSVRFTCGTVNTAVRYEFQYKVGNEAGTIAPLNAGSNITQPFPITKRGAYKVQCRPCTGAQCTPWTEDWTANLAPATSPSPTPNQTPNTMTDPSNCGSIGVQCPSGAQCVAGVCTTP